MLKKGSFSSCSVYVTNLFEKGNKSVSKTWKRKGIGEKKYRRRVIIPNGQQAQIKRHWLNTKRATKQVQLVNSASVVVVVVVVVLVVVGACEKNERQ